MSRKIGFIGSGVMAQAIMRGMVTKGVVNAENVFVSDIDKKKLEEVKQDLGVQPVQSNKELAEKSDVLILALKPDVCAAVMEEMLPYLREDQIFISIAAGWSTKKLRDGIQNKAKVLKVMPNTPALVGEGVMIFSKDNDLSEEELEEVKRYFEANGIVEFLEESKMFATTGISGTIPACVSMYIEALADGGVNNGLSRDFALRVAAQAVLGSAKLVLESGKHPGVLKDQVCTPGGTTIEAVVSLEEDGFRGTVIRACNRCTKKSFDMMNK